MKPLKIVVPAEVEFREALSWYRDRDPRVADRFATEAQNTLGRIQTFPKIGSRVPGFPNDVRRMPIQAFPYYIVFTDLADRVEVVAFAHHRRQPGYFTSRLHRT